MILCIGDMIQDHWTFGTATRICPEAPVPVVVPDRYHISAGGVGLVASQLQELGAEVYTWEGSFSKKTRIFAGSHLITRIDEDSLTDYRDENGVKRHFEPEPFPDEMLRACECVVVSDYGKGAIFPEISEEIIKSGKPLFVDAKKSWQYYDSSFCTWFPNEHEYLDACNLARHCRHALDIQIVEKRGKHGAKWGDVSVNSTVTDVVDTTGAGDIFLAAFVYANMMCRLIPFDCLQYANTLAGESCRHLGTYIVPKAYARLVLGTMLPYQELKQPIPFADYDSSEEEGLIQPALFEKLLASGLREWYSRIPNLNVDQATREAKVCIDEYERTHRKSTSNPTKFGGEDFRASGNPSDPTGYGKIMAQQAQNSNVISHHNEHKPGQDLSQNPVQSKPQV